MKVIFLWIKTYVAFLNEKRLILKKIKDQKDREYFLEYYNDILKKWSWTLELYIKGRYQDAMDLGKLCIDLRNSIANHYHEIMEN